MRIAAILSVALCCLLAGCSEKKNPNPISEAEVLHGSYIVNTSSLIVRDTPSRFGKPIGRLHLNEVIDGIENSKKSETIDGVHANWYRIRSSLYEGFVFSGYLATPAASETVKWPFEENNPYMRGVDRDEPERRMKIEAAVIASDAAHFQRRDGTLVVTCMNGKDLSFVSSGSETTTRHYYAHNLIASRWLIVEEAHWEGASYYLVDMNSGAQIKVISSIGRPSPDSSYIAFFAMDDAYGPSGMQIVGTDGAPRIEYEAQDLIYDVEWVDSTTLRAYRANSFSDESNFNSVTELERKGERWSILKPRQLLNGTLDRVPEAPQN